MKTPKSYNTYLAGGINGLTDAEAKDWRERAKELLLTSTLDPMRRDYRGVEILCAEEIVISDLDDISSSKFLLVNATRPSWGTAMEIAYARMWNIPVFAFIGASKLTPWVKYHCSIHETLEEACDEINQRVRTLRK